MTRFRCKAPTLCRVTQLRGGTILRKLLLAAFAALLAAGSAQAIVNGEPDGTRHPYVAAIGFIDAATGRPGAFCSGTLVSPTVIVTAGHCTYHSAAAFVWFDPQWNPSKPPAAVGRAGDASGLQSGSDAAQHGRPGGRPAQQPDPMPTYGALPGAAYLENLGEGERPRAGRLDRRLRVPVPRPADSHQ